MVCVVGVDGMIVMVVDFLVYLDCELELMYVLVVM